MAIVHVQAQSIDKEANKYFDLIRPAFKGDLAYNTVSFVEKYWRVAGNTGFNETVYLIEKELKQAGYVNEEEANENNRLSYRIETRQMSKPTWEPVNASLQIIGENTPLLSQTTNRNMVYLYSHPTQTEAEVVWIKDASELTTEHVKGKIVFAEMSGRRLFGKAIKELGALGMMTYDMPSYLQPEKNQTAIQFRSLPYDRQLKPWAIALSFEAKERLKAALKSGEVKVKVDITTKLYNSEELTVVANIKGSELPRESLVFSAHIQEPGANDNASGVGAQLEMATIAARLLNEDKIDTKRTMTFLWGDEIISTHRYIQEEEKRTADINWGISLDMVGEDTEKTGGSFLIEKMPDPSAIWTRGNDKHSEWGGSPLDKDQMKPHYFNDFIISVFKNQGQFANWVVNNNPFEGGSDHTPFLRADIPGLLLWHFTDQFYHTDKDRIDKVSQVTLTNVGTAALASALVLCNGNEETATGMTELTLNAALSRMTIEFDLGLSLIAKKESTKAKEIDILETWADYYVKSLEKVVDLANSPKVEKAIGEAKYKIEEYAAELIAQLK